MSPGKILEFAVADFRAALKEFGYPDADFLDKHGEIDLESADLFAFALYGVSPNRQEAERIQDSFLLLDLATKVVKRKWHGLLPLLRQEYVKRKAVKSK